SSQSPQAKAYRQSRHLEEENETLIGVLVQRMVDAVVSGVAFTINPVTGADELVVNAAWGLGEALVSGQVTPDEFVVEKGDTRDRRVRSSRPGAQNGDAGRITLTPERLAELAELLLRVESYYRAPQDVEWCHDGRQFWIVQSRPITADARLKPSRSIASTA